MINQVTLVGRLTKDPDMRLTNEGIPVTHITLAVNRHFKNHDGQIEADFVQCTLWRKPAENTARFCQKGSVVGITGRIQSRHYDNSEGRRVYITDVVAETVQFLGKKVSGNAPIPVPTPTQRQAADSTNRAASTQVAAATQAATTAQTATTSSDQEPQDQAPAQSQQETVIAAAAQATSAHDNTVLIAEALSASESGHGSGSNMVDPPF